MGNKTVTKNASRSNEIFARYQHLHLPSQSTLEGSYSQSPQTTLPKQQAFVERFVSLAFDDAAALIYGRIRAELERAGTPIGPNDLLIASIALANGLILVTHNTQEFSRITGLQTEDWELR